MSDSLLPDAGPAVDELADLEPEALEALEEAAALAAEASAAPADHEPATAVAPPAERDPVAAFWSAGDGFSALDDATPHGDENALQKLGRPPFERSIRTKFRLLGYLATVYEHVSQDHRDATVSGPN